MLDLISDIRNAIISNCPYSALALALTLPDICSQVEAHTLEGSRTIYADWFDTYVYNPYYEHKDIPPNRASYFEFRGDYCYLLRCRFLHNGNSRIYQKMSRDKITVNISKFELSMTNIQGKYLDTVSIRSNADNSDYDYDSVEMRIDGLRLCHSLCNAAEQFYTSWPNKADFESHTIVFADTKIEYQQFLNE